MTAELYMTKEGHVELTVIGHLGQPAPEHPLLAEENEGFSYHDVVSVKTNEQDYRGTTTTISLVRGTGRGQTKAFDRLVGDRIAALRLTVARELRNAEYGGDKPLESRLTVSISGDERDVLRERIEVHADDKDHTFFARDEIDRLARFDTNFERVPSVS